MVICPEVLSRTTQKLATVTPFWKKRLETAGSVVPSGYAFRPPAADEAIEVKLPMTPTAPEGTLTELPEGETPVICSVTVPPAGTGPAAREGSAGLLVSRESKTLI